MTMYTRVWISRLYRKVTDPETGRTERVLRSPSWYVNWRDPETGKQRMESCGPRKRDAERRAREIEGQIASGAYKPKRREATWDEFRTKFERDVMHLHSEGHQEQMQISLNAFELLCKPELLGRITSETIDQFKGKRAAERYRGRTIAPRTINRDLGNIRTALRRAKRWGLIEDVPEFEMCRLEDKRPPYVPVETFRAIFAACPDAFWRGAVAVAYLAGLRRNEILSLRWSDLDLDSDHQTITIRAEVAKARRDDIVPLVAELAALLRGLRPPAAQVSDGTDHDRQSAVDEDALVFPWPRSMYVLYRIWHQIQDGAGIDRKHHVTLHDLRRSFGTNLAPHADVASLQRLMRHRNIATTLKHYVDGEQHMRHVVAKLPPVLPPNVGNLLEA